MPIQAAGGVLDAMNATIGFAEGISDTLGEKTGFGGITFGKDAENGIMLWDVAAGVALVRAAGGHVDITQSSEDVLWSYNIQASGSPNLWAP